MKKFLRSPLLTLLLFVAAAVLLVVGSVGTTQAALTRESDIYRTEMKLRNIGVTLLESTKEDGSSPETISFRSYGTGTSGRWASEQTGVLVRKMVSDAGDTTLKVGKTYPFYLSVQNSGQVNEYVRVTIYKYWVDANGQKIESDGWFNGNGDKKVKFDPTLIEITPNTSSNWTLEDVTDERMVFYYTPQLDVGDTTLDPLTSALTINSGIIDYAIKDANGVIKYAYDNLGFVIDVQVDAVQAKHSDQSVPSAWGVVR